jgi:hypothetical protein
LLLKILETPFYNIKRKASLLLILLILFLLFPAHFYALENPLIQYLNQKSLSNYEKAIAIIEEWTIDEKDPVIIETNIFRIYELIKYPELIENSIRAYKNILENISVKNNYTINARVNIFLNILYLRKGSIDEARILRNTLGFIDKYKAAGPFKNNDFNRSFLQEEEISKGDPEKISNNTEWFDAETDPAGTIEAADLLGDVSGSVMYFKSSFSVPADGNYVLRLGKTGYSDIWMDGQNVFSNREKHAFAFDQYCILLSLSGGEHILLLKTGDSKSGLKFALRLTDEDGKSTVNIINENDKSASAVQTWFRNITFFDALEKSIKIKPMEKQAAFNTAYLYYISGLNNEYDGEAKILFAKAESGSFGSASNYYLGLLAGEKEKESYFNKSLSLNKENVESISEIAYLKLRNNLDAEAFRLSGSIREINSQSFHINKLKARIFNLRGWYTEALKEAYPSKNRVNSIGCEIEADFYLKNKKYKKALMPCKLLYETDNYSIINLNNLIDCYINTGMYDEALGMLSKSSRLFPNNVMLRLKMAKLIGNIKDPVTALPYLLHARKMSPYNKDVLSDTGIVYHKLDKEELAFLYLNMALKRDPKNKRISDYIEFIKLTSGLQAKSSKSGLDTESEVFKSIFSGDDNSLYNNIEKLLNADPAGPDSILFYTEIGKLSSVVGYERCTKTLLKLIDSINSIEKKNLNILYLKLELEKLFYRYKISEAKKYSEEFFPVAKWMIFGPYFKYGPADIDFSFMPELITNLKNSDIKRREILIQDSKGELDFNRYLYPEQGIAYAMTTVTLNQPVKIRVYSKSSYKLYLNGREAIKNLKSGIFRNCRIINVKDIGKITLMIKMSLNEKNNCLRVLITDENDKPLKTESGISEVIFSDVRFNEEMDYPYEYLTARSSESSGKDKAGINFKLGRYFHGLGSREALKYYRKSIVDKDLSSDIRLYFLAECLLEMSNWNKESAGYLEGIEIIKKLVKKHPEFIPACHLLLKENLKKMSFSETYKESYMLFRNGENYIKFKLDYSAYLIKTGFEKEFLKEIDLLKSSFPDATEPLLLLALYYSSRDIFKTIEIYKMILNRETSEAALRGLVNIYKQLGRYQEIKSLMEYYDAEGHFRNELIEALIDTEDFKNAKKEIFHGLTEKDDSYYNIKLGEITYLEGYDPAMYWKKALFVNPSNNSLRDYLNYLETGSYNNTALRKNGSDGFENTNILLSIKDIRDFVFWYRSLLQEAFNVETGGVNLLFAGRSPDEQIKSVYEFISRKIELKGNIFFSPHNAMDTFYKKSGSAEDKTVLALSMLDGLGIKSYIALTGMNEFTYTTGFSPEIFTNILLFVPLDVNTGLWMDFSNERFDIGETSSSLTGKDAVVILKDSYEIKKIAGKQ